jgi:uncharacterized protein UPF0220
VHVTFADWVPGLCSLLGILVVNLIDKDRIRGEEGFSDSSAVWRARLFLFVGFALMAGGLAGSVVRHFFSHSPRVWKPIDYPYRRCWCSSTSFPGIQSSISTTGMPTSQRTCRLCFRQLYSGSRKVEVASTNTVFRFDFMRVNYIVIYLRIPVCVSVNRSLIPIASCPSTLQKQIGDRGTAASSSPQANSGTSALV